MKKIIMLVVGTIIFTLGFIYFIDKLIYSGVYWVTGSTEKAVLDSNGNIVINEEEISDQSTYITYDYEGATIGLIAFRTNKDKIIVVINASKSCKEAPNAIYIQRNNQFVCQNCNRSFNINDIEKHIDNECGLTSIKDKANIDGKIIIGTKELQEFKDRFINWKGPKE